MDFLVYLFALGFGIFGYLLGQSALSFWRAERGSRIRPPPTCATCCLARGALEELGCRAEPPHLMLDAGALHSGWPRVRPQDWCARHAPIR